MPCASCGRTTRHESLRFYFNRKSRHFLCSFCMEGIKAREKAGETEKRREEARAGRAKTGEGTETRRMEEIVNGGVAENIEGYSPPAYRSLLNLGAILILSLFFFSWMPMANTMTYVMEKDINGPEPVSIENATVGQHVRLFGRINSTSERVIYTEKDGGGNRQTVMRNFTLNQMNETIYVVVSNTTEAHRYENESGELEYRNDDLVYVVGQIEVVNGTKAIKAENIYDIETHLDEARAGVKIILFVGALVLLELTAVMIYAFLSPVIYSGFRRKKTDGGNGHKGKDARGEESFLKEMQAIENLSQKGSAWTNIYRKIYLWIAGISLVMALLLFGVYLYFTAHIRDPYANFMLSPFLLLSLFVPDILFAYFMEKALNSLRRVIVGEEGLLLFRETTEPYFIPWEHVKDASILLDFRWLSLQMDDGRRLRFKLPKSVLKDVERAWDSRALSA